MAGTLAPIAAGVIMWKLQKPQHIQKYNSQGRLYWDYYKDPDRTLPIALIVAGVMIGPSTGYIYGGCPNKVLLFKVGLSG